MDQLHELLRDLLHWVESFADSPHGVWALMVLSFAESSFFPVPPDVLLIALCLGRPDLAFWFAGACAVASVLGGMAGYGIGFWGGRPLLKRLFRPDRVRAVEGYYDRYNAWATGIAGLTPIPYKVFTLSGGAFSIDFKVFVLASIISRSLRFFAVAAIVYWLGDAASNFIDEYLGWLTIGFVVLLVVGFWLAGRGARHASRQGE
jgi:membrane protein YqaA with SNARE-associated domain